jgi:hypothetical protein
VVVDEEKLSALLPESPTPVESSPVPRFARNRFLQLTGGVLLSLLTLGRLSQGQAFAAHCPPPLFCGGSCECDCCDEAGNCCTKNCTRRFTGCGPDGVGWCGCVGSSLICCWDWWDYGDQACICRQTAGQC